MLLELTCPPQFYLVFTQSFFLIFFEKKLQIMYSTETFSHYLKICKKRIKSQRQYRRGGNVSIFFSGIEPTHQKMIPKAGAQNTGKKDIIASLPRKIETDRISFF